MSVDVFQGLLSIHCEVGVRLQFNVGAGLLKGFLFEFVFFTRWLKTFESVVSALFLRFLLNPQVLGGLAVGDCAEGLASEVLCLRADFFVRRGLIRILVLNNTDKLMVVLLEINLLAVLRRRVVVERSFGRQLDSIFAPHEGGIDHRQVVLILPVGSRSGRGGNAVLVRAVAGQPAHHFLAPPLALVHVVFGKAFVAGAVGAVDRFVLADEVAHSASLLVVIAFNLIGINFRLLGVSVGVWLSHLNYCD